MAKYYPQWRNENSIRSYPFEETALRQSNEDAFIIPNNWLVDACFFVSSVSAPLYLSSINVFGFEAVIIISDSSGIEVGRATIDRSSRRPIKISNQLGDWVGTLVTGMEANHPIFSLGDGVYEFGESQTTFVASCIFSLPTDIGVSYLTNSYGQVYTSSELVFVGEQGIQLEVSPAQEYQTLNRIIDVDLMRIHAIGDPQFLQRNCDENTRRPRRFIREIVFQYGDQTHICFPDESGNILIVAESSSVEDTALQIRSQSDGVVFRLSGKSI